MVFFSVGICWNELKFVGICWNGKLWFHFFVGTGISVFQQVGKMKKHGNELIVFSLESEKFLFQQRKNVK